MGLELVVDDGVPQDLDGPSTAIRAAVEFRVHVVHEGGAVRLCPVGEIDIATIGQLRERLDEVTSDDITRLVLDLRETTFCDSTGVHFAVDAERWTAQRRIPFAIIPGPRAVQRTFEVAGLAAQLPFVDARR